PQQQRRRGDLPDPAGIPREVLADLRVLEYERVGDRPQESRPAITLALGLDFCWARACLAMSTTDCAVALATKMATHAIDNGRNFFIEKSRAELLAPFYRRTC
ncbi:MAG TPA: hypothetical protein VI685_19320, partial [Candidatus Angelobacter sp.]